MVVLALGHALITLLLVIYAMAFAILTVYALIHRRRATALPACDPSTLPFVTVQVPLYNEKCVVERIIDCVAALDYPHDRFEIQILDDSSDETARLADARAAVHRARGIDIAVVRRVDRQGFKAGALRWGMATARGELVAIFDADFCPPVDFLRKTVPHFLTNARLGVVQGRWSHLNAEYSLLTQCEALILDGHFIVEQAVRCRSGLLMTFNGTGGVWRRGCIEDAGGWQDETLAEDLDLSYRAHLAGWEFLFLPELALPAEVPPQLAAFKRQQARWAQGAIQTLRKLGARILASPRLRWHQKTMVFVQLSAYFAHPLMVLLVLGAPLFLKLPSSLRLDLGPLGLVFVGPPLLYVVSQWQLYRGWGHLRALPVLVLLGIGIGWSNALGVWRGLTRYGGDWVRTPKFCIEGQAGHWAHSHYRLSIDATTCVELLLALYALGTFGLAWHSGQHWMSPFLLLSATAFGVVGGMGLVQGFVARGPAPGPDPAQ